MMSFLPAAVLPLLLAATVPDGGFLGVYIEDQNGPVVTDVIPDTPAARAGFEKGDRFLAVDGKETPDRQTFLEVIGAYDPGDRVELLFERKGERMTKRVRLTRRPANLEERGEAGAEEAREDAAAADRERAEKEAEAAQAKAEKAAKAAAERAEKSAKAAAEKAEKSAKAAAEKAEKSAKAAAEKAARATEKAARVETVEVPALRARGGARPFLGVQLEDAENVVVGDVVEGSPAARAGVQSGDRITRLGESSVDSFEALGEALQKTAIGDSVNLVVERDGRPVELRVKIGSRDPQPAEAEPETPRPNRAAAPTPPAPPAAGGGAELEAVRGLRREIGELRREIAQLRELVQQLERRGR